MFGLKFGMQGLTKYYKKLFWLFTAYQHASELNSQRRTHPQQTTVMDERKLFSYPNFILILF